MDNDHMKIINPKTRLPEYEVGEDNRVEDLNPSRIETDRTKKKGQSDEPHSTETA
jgi:hypothetical protein